MPPALALLDSLLAFAARVTGLSPQFLRFGVVGSIGFCIDTATVYSLRGLAGLYVAGAAGFFVAGTANWALNRLWTFRHLAHGAAHKQWLRFFAANSIGFVANRGTFFFLVTISPLCHRQPVLAIVAGSLAGLIFNYWLSKKYVFH